jgi:hypothetical protein
MKKSLEFIPALFCFLYFEVVAFSVASVDDPPMDLVPMLAIMVAPILSFLLVTILFWRWGAFRRRFTRFIRSMLVVLATAGAIGVFETIAFCIPSGGGQGPPPPFFVVIFVAASSLTWLPLTLVIAAAYCLPLWAWEGRHDPDHLSRRLARTIYWHRLRILGVLAVGIATGAALLKWDHWRQISANPSWVCSAPKNLPCQLTTGWAPDGTEVVVAHAVSHDEPYAESDIVSLDARNGHVRWEKRAESAFTTTIDPDRNVVYTGNGAVVTKLSGADGGLLWQQRVEETNIHVKLFPPVADSTGQIWISGIKGTWSNNASRFLALLETGDGKVRWEKMHAPEEISAIYPPRIFPLKGGDAFSVLPPEKDGFPGTHEWIMQRLSGKNGDVQWEVDEPSMRNDIENVHWLVDEPHDQVVIVLATYPPQGTEVINLVAYDLLTGKEKWHAVNPAPVAGIGPGVVNMSFDNHDNLILWYTTKEFNTSWFDRWIAFSPLALIDARNNDPYRTRNFRIVFSITDGRMLDCQKFGGRYEELFTVLSGPGTGPPGTAIMQVRKPDNSLGPWRAILLNHGALPDQGGLPLFARQPRAPYPNWTYNGDAVVTPSGKLVICDFNGGWQIRAW